MLPYEVIKLLNKIRDLLTDMEISLNTNFKEQSMKAKKKNSKC